MTQAEPIGWVTCFAFPSSIASARAYDQAKRLLKPLWQTLNLSIRRFQIEDGPFAVALTVFEPFNKDVDDLFRKACLGAGEPYELGDSQVAVLLKRRAQALKDQTEGSVREVHWGDEGRRLL